MLNKLSCLAATFLIYDEHEPFDRVVQASSLYRISVSTTRAASSSLRRGARGAARRASATRPRGCCRQSFRLRDRRGPRARSSSLVKAPLPRPPGCVLQAARRRAVGVMPEMLVADERRARAGPGPPVQRAACALPWLHLKRPAQGLLVCVKPAESARWAGHLSQNALPRAT